MLSLAITALLSTAFAAEMPVCEDFSTDAASFGQVYKIQTQVADTATGFHCRGERGERISGWETDPSGFLAHCGNNLFAGETCYTGDQAEALTLLKQLGEKSIGSDYSLSDVRKRGETIVYSIKNKKGRVDPRYDQLSAGRCTKTSFEP